MFTNERWALLLLHLILGLVVLSSKLRSKRWASLASRALLELTAVVLGVWGAWVLLEVAQLLIEGWEAWAALDEELGCLDAAQDFGFDQTLGLEEPCGRSALGVSEGVELCNNPDNTGVCAERLRRAAASLADLESILRADSKPNKGC